jgi:hypothetical protein
VGTLQSVLLARFGIAQVEELGAESLLADGELVDLFPDWPRGALPVVCVTTVATPATS